MRAPAGWRLSRLPLRLRLALWILLSLGLILAVYAAFLYLQIRRSLIAQVDAALQLAAGQAAISLVEEGGQLSFRTAERDLAPIRQVGDDYVIHLLTRDGALLETLAFEADAPRFPSQETGTRTMTAEGEPWRVYTQEVTVDGQVGRLQVAQELDPITQTLASLRAQMILGLPLALLLAGLGGLFLAGRAMWSIDRITQTARAISANDLGQRIHHQGPADEVGRLAQTFDDMLDRLQAAFARERRFTADAAHELRTPLAALKGRIGVTLSRPRQAAAYAATLQEMEGQVDRLIRLSNDLLLIAQLDQGRIRPQPERIALADLIGAVLHQVRPLAEAKSISLVVAIAPGLTLQGDLDLLIRLHLNLLDNAIKYTPAGGRVTVQAKTAADQVIVSVSDTGPGIPAQHLPHLFERFYRAEGDRARGQYQDGQDGAGLGLAIAHEIARAHRGSLTVQSDLGRGTSFFVRLPFDS